MAMVKLWKRYHLVHLPPIGVNAVYENVYMRLPWHRRLPGRSSPSHLGNWCEMA